MLWLFALIVPLWIFSLEVLTRSSEGEMKAVQLDSLTVTSRLQCCSTLRTWSLTLWSRLVAVSDQPVTTADRHWTSLDVLTQLLLLTSTLPIVTCLPVDEDSLISSSSVFKFHLKCKRAGVTRSNSNDSLSLTHSLLTVSLKVQVHFLS